MIVPMKKIQALFLARHRDEVLAELRAAGVIHLAPSAPPAGADLDTLRKQAQEIRDEIERLAALRPVGADTRPEPDADALLTALRGSRGRLEQLAVEHATLLRRLEELAPFGDFDPAAFTALAGAGRKVWLLRIPAAALNQAPPAGAVLFVVNRSRTLVWAAQIGGDAPLASAEEISVPSEAPVRLRARIAELQRAMEREAQTPERTAAHLPVLRRHLLGLESSIELLEARLGLSAQDDILVLAGYVPAEEAGRLVRQASLSGWGAHVTDPTPEDQPPTLIRNPAWIRPVESVLRAIGIVPGYRETDISPAFLLFFSLFFAMLVGDAGYGAVFLGLTLLVRRKRPNAPAEPFRMMGIASTATMIWGALTGTAFGMGFPAAPLAEWAASDRNVMQFCFFIGATHLTLAHVWAALRQWNHPAALSHIGYILTTWTMFFLAGEMVLSKPAPDGVGWLFLAGLVLIVLFMTPLRELRTQWFNHVMLPLSLVGNFVDVISYLRLFAVGFAGLAMASTFNEMAGSGSGFPGAVAGVFILIVGHALNLTLAAMGVLVHGVRLNTLEFSSHIGNQWSGRPYAPFAPRHEGEISTDRSTTPEKEQ